MARIARLALFALLLLFVLTLVRCHDALRLM
jgi:hypothetical protein